MKKAISAVFGTAALAAGIFALGAPESNILTFDWFGRFCLAALVCLIALWLMGAFTEDDKAKTTNHEILKEG